MLKLRKNKKGFSMVELIVVIAIMAVLAGIIGGVVVSTQNKAKNSAADILASKMAEEIKTMIQADFDSIDEPIYINKTGTSLNIDTIRKDLEEEVYKGQIVDKFDEKTCAAGKNMFAVVEADGNSINVTYQPKGSGSAQKGYTITVDFKNEKATKDVYPKKADE